MGVLKNYLTSSIIHSYCKSSVFTVILNHSFLSVNFKCDHFYFNLPFALIRRQKGISVFLNKYPNKKDNIWCKLYIV